MSIEAFPEYEFDDAGKVVNRSSGRVLKSGGRRGNEYHLRRNEGVSGEMRRVTRVRTLDSLRGVDRYGDLLSVDEFPEKCKVVPGFDRYVLGESGTLYSRVTGREIAEKRNSNGYFYTLHRGGERFNKTSAALFRLVYD